MTEYELSDGTELSIPCFAFYSLQHGYGIENHGISPDIEVRCSKRAERMLCRISDCCNLGRQQVDYGPLDYLDGRDPQLERAIAVALEQLAARPPLPDLGRTPDFRGRAG